MRERDDAIHVHIHPRIHTHTHIYINTASSLSLTPAYPSLSRRDWAGYYLGEKTGETELVVIHAYQSKFINGWASHAGRAFRRPYQNWREDWSFQAQARFSLLSLFFILFAHTRSIGWLLILDRKSSLHE